MSIWQELIRRKVLRVAAAYVVASWVLMQVASLLEATLELPAWFDKVFLASLLLGFPIALLLSWAYEVSPDMRSESRATSTGRSAFLAAVVGLAAVSFGYIYVQFLSESATVANSHEHPSIAVLPFADMSPNSDQAWFADGVSEEILNVLAGTEGLMVASRTASFRYRDEDIDIKIAAKELDVGLILEGSVRSQGDDLRITAQLIDAQSGFHLWSETFDRELSDIFAVQEEISISIATALFGEIGIDALPDNRFNGTENIAAYSAYLKGREILSLGEPDRSYAAMTYFEEAVGLDPEFAAAWAAIARSERIQGIIELRPPSNSNALKRALALDPDNAASIVQLARYNWGELRWLEAEQLFLRAVLLAPNDPEVHERFAGFLRNTGRTRRALTEYLRAWELGSESRLLVSAVVNSYAYLGEFANARSFFEMRLAEIGLENMTGTEAYFVSLLADDMEGEAREFAKRDLPLVVAVRLQYFLGRLDGDPEARRRLVEATHLRIHEYGSPRWGDIENFLLADEIELARQLTPETLGYGWSNPQRMILHINPEIDPRYLPFKPNKLALIDLFPGVPEAFADIGFDVMARARENGFIE